MISFTVPGRLGGKGRPKFARRGKFVVAYTPEKTRSTEAMVKHFASIAMGGRAALEGPLGLDILVFQAPAASWSQKKKAAAQWVTGKPDCDNVAKLVGDSLNGIVWQDDAQISALHFERHYNQTEAERVEIRIYALTESRWNRG